MIDALAEFIDGGRVKLFCVGSNNHESFLNSSAHPLHRSWRQRMFDEYIREEVFPFIYTSCQTETIAISTMGASLGAYHAANTLFRYPHRVKRCYALSGVYDLKRFMNGVYDDNFYFHNPVDYMANLDDGWNREQLASCEIHLATGSGPWEESRFSYTMSDDPRAEGHPPLSGRLGPARRSRLAVLEGRDAGVSVALVDASGRQRAVHDEHDGTMSGK